MIRDQDGRAGSLAVSSPDLLPPPSRRRNANLIATYWIGRR